jgi:hypothetical protein
MILRGSRCYCVCVLDPVQIARSSLYPVALLSCLASGFRGFYLRVCHGLDLLTDLAPHYQSSWELCNPLQNDPSGHNYNTFVCDLLIRQPRDLDLQMTS